MSQILLPQRFFSQPQYPAPIDYAGLGKGVQLLFNPATGPIDLATNRVWTSGGNASITVGQKGKQFSFDGVDDYYAYTGYPELTSNVGTFFIWLPIVGSPDDFGHVYFGSSTPVVCGHQVNTSNQIVIGTGSGDSSGSLTNWFNSRNRSMVLVSNGTAAGTKAYVDGRDTGFTWGSPPTAWGAGDKNFNFGRYVGASTIDFNGSILTLGITSAVWGAAEAKAFHENPWLLFRAPARRIWTVSAGGTTHDLAGASASQANIAGSGPISQTHALSVQTSAQTNSASVAGITQAHALTGSASTQANASAADAITQAHALTGSASTQGNAASAGEVTQGAQFAADPATQANTAGTGAISQTHALSGAGSTQSQTASAASITQAHALTGASATQANVAAQGAISQGVVHDLAASAATQANTGATSAITQAHVLVSAPSIQDNIAAASAIVQAHILAALSAAQANSASSGAIATGDNALVSIVERTATFRRSKSVTVRFN